MSLRFWDVKGFRALVLLLALISPLAAQTSEPRVSGTLSFRPADSLNAIAFDHYYNLDYDRAIQEFRQVLDRHPNDPFALNHLLTAVQFKELYRIGALNTADYSNDSFIGKIHQDPDPKVKEEIKALVARATNLEEERLKKNPDDVDALYARGVTRAQFSTYTALMEHAWFSALRNAVGARRDHERVLELDPNYTDAKLIVGAHNYVMGSLPWAVKAAVSVVGLSGSKDKGLDYLRAAAAGNGETSVDAKILLALCLRREHRYAESLPLIRELIPAYPRDVLLALEEGNLQRAMGQSQESAATYRKIWEAGREGHYGNLHYEVAALNLGDLLRSEKDYAGAAAAYDQVNEVKFPDPETQQKANLGAGEMYDLMQKRDLAVKKYQAVIASNADTPPAEIARRYIKEPYRQD
ncbi:MAG TPA: tetratricopeptide repeat protein [Terriglobales bacterium]|nr:tetratricopeptide repeat protein [Terriglobales bacterium]